MPTPTKGPRLGSGPAHERLMLANLASALFEHGRITTTEAKARRLRPFAERLITKAKKDGVHNRRQVVAALHVNTRKAFLHEGNKHAIVHKLFTDIAPRYENRPGGYTRIVKVAPRKGDNAPMAVIELVEALTIAQEAVGEAEQARKTRFARKKAAGVADVPVVETPAATTAEAVPADADATSEQTAQAADKAQAEGDATSEQATEATTEATGTAQAEGDADKA